MPDLTGNVTTTRTTCPYCGVGCGVLASQDAEGHIAITGDPHHPANAGKLCSKGFSLGETFNDEHRLLSPSVEGQDVSWNQATRHIASTLQQTIEQHGRESVAFYVSGQLLTEDYYVVNKFVKGWLGTANIDTNSRLCMASSVAGHKRAFGSDTVPGCYEDLDSAMLIVLVGSNLAWCHPVIYQRIMTRKALEPELCIVAIDPRRSITADNADIHLAIKPDGDTLLFNALLAYLHKHHAVDHAYIEQHVSGFEQALEQSGDDSLNSVAAQLGITEHDLSHFFDKVVNTPKTVTVYSQGVNQSRSGTDKVNAIINCHLATGRIGKPGTGPFSITGQPNAMGGREVGGLATMLACHRELDNPDHQSQVQRFWQSPYIAIKPGLTAVDMFKAIENGSIKAVWIMATNPVDSLPDANAIAAALSKCPFVVVSDVSTRTDTVQYAHVTLPAQAFGEKDGTVTNSERRISRQKRFMEPVGQAKPDWWAVAEVAKLLGYADAFNYESPADIFVEYAQLSAFENNGEIDFDIGACAALTQAQYDALRPFQWPRRKEELPPVNLDSGADLTLDTTVGSFSVTGTDKDSTSPSASTSKLPIEEPIRFFENGNFYTPDKRARMIPVTPAHPGNPQLCNQYPLVLNTGRIRDQWHTMTRTGYISRLMAHRAEPFVEIHPADAVTHGVTDADVVRLTSPTGTMLARAMLSDRQQPGQLFTAMHWTDQFASNARVDTLIEAYTDPVSQQPASKNQIVSLQHFPAKAFAYLLTREQPDLSDNCGVEYWAMSPVDNGWRTEIASSMSVNELTDQLRFCVRSMTNGGVNTIGQYQQADYTDRDVRRIAWFNENEQLHAMLYLASNSVQLSRSWASTQLNNRFNTPLQRSRLMAGRPANDQPDKGAIVCSCFHVGDKEIERAVKSGRCKTTNAIGNNLGAGTNCGSCRNEIDVIVRRYTELIKPSVSTHKY